MQDKKSKKGAACDYLPPGYGQLGVKSEADSALSFRDKSVDSMMLSFT
jgi:hypothetical protein